MSAIEKIINFGINTAFSLILSGLLSHAVQAGTISSQSIISCNVIKGRHKAAIGANCNLPTKSKMVTRISTQPNYIADYKIYCPQNESVTITKEAKYYEHTKDNRFIKNSDRVDDEDALYTDAECTEVWDPNQKSCFRPTEGNDCYSGSLYCKRSIKDKANSSKKLLVVEFTVYY